MPPLSRRYLATAALCLLLGIGLGFVLLIRREYHGIWPGPLAVSAHTHLILVGSVIEAIFGTAVWLFPRPVRGAWQTPRWIGESAWGTLTAGTLLRAAVETFATGNRAAASHAAIVAGAALQVIGIVMGIVMLVPRIRPSAERPTAPSKT